MKITKIGLNRRTYFSTIKYYTLLKLIFIKDNLLKTA